MREIITDKYNCQRYKSNKIVRYLLDTHTTVDLNLIVKLHQSDFFTKEDIKEFYQLIGYSVSGYEDIFYEEE